MAVYAGLGGLRRSVSLFAEFDGRLIAVAKTTDLAGEDAATALACMLHVTGESIGEVERLPGTWHGVSQFNPFFYMIDGFRYGFIGHSDGSVLTGVVVLIAVDLALWALCHRLFASGYKLKA